MISDYALHKMLDLTLRGTAYTPPASVWLTFASDNIEPQDSSISEFTIGAGAYARKQITFGNAAAYREVYNTAAINFPAPTADWGTAKWAVIMDAATSGNWLFAVPMCALPVKSGSQPPSVPVNRLRVHLCYPGISTYLGNKWLDHLLRNTAYTPPDDVYLALAIGTISHEDSGVTDEVTGAGYARKVLAFAAAADRLAHSSAAAAFDPATADWGTAAAPIISQAIANAEEDGDLLFYEDICPKVVLNGDQGPSYPVKGVRVGGRPC